MMREIVKVKKTAVLAYSVAVVISRCEESHVSLSKGILGPLNDKNKGFGVTKVSN